MVILAGASYGVYKLISTSDDPEHANLLTKEISRGLGIRVNSFDAPYRISLFEPSYMKGEDSTLFFSSNQHVQNNKKINLKLVNFEYTW